MSIVDGYQGKSIVVQTDNGQVYLDKNFKLENDQPMRGFVKITDLSDDRIFWFNFNAITWIGPR